MRFHRFKNVRYPEQPSDPQESQGCERTEPLPSGAAAVGCGPKRVEAAGGYLSLSPCPSGVLFSRWYPPNNLHGNEVRVGLEGGSCGKVLSHTDIQVHWIRMNRLFVSEIHRLPRWGGGGWFHPPPTHRGRSWRIGALYIIGISLSRDRQARQMWGIDRTNHVQFT